MSYRKIWFESKSYGATAGLILETDKFRLMLRGPNGISNVSRLFPMSEALKMGALFCSPEFETWDEAFAYVPANSETTL